MEGGGLHGPCHDPVSRMRRPWGGECSAVLYTDRSPSSESISADTLSRKLFFCLFVRNCQYFCKFLTLLRFPFADERRESTGNGRETPREKLWITRENLKHGHQHRCLYIVGYNSERSSISDRNVTFTHLLYMNHGGYTITFVSFCNMLKKIKQSSIDCRSINLSNVNNILSNSLRELTF